ncbi:hypothetical protein IVB07_39025 (plasmid) [Bradyrhizobium sp. 172]|nr:hypothetical protein IVB07_39025 [Bradyrhizobium sp. 172]
MPSRLRNALEIEGVKTVGEVRNMADADLLSFQNLGAASVRHLRQLLELREATHLEKDVAAADPGAAREANAGPLLQCPRREGCGSPRAYWRLALGLHGGEGVELGSLVRRRPGDAVKVRTECLGAGRAASEGCPRSFAFCGVSSKGFRFQTRTWDLDRQSPPLFVSEWIAL